MAMTENGVSTTHKLGSEQYEKYTSNIGRKRTTMYQYDYRHIDGELFSCCAPTLIECRKRRDIWLSNK